MSTDSRTTLLRESYLLSEKEKYGASSASGYVGLGAGTEGNTEYTGTDCAPKILINIPLSFILYLAVVTQYFRTEVAGRTGDEQCIEVIGRGRLELHPIVVGTAELDLVDGGTHEFLEDLNEHRGGGIDGAEEPGGRRDVLAARLDLRIALALLAGALERE